MSVALLVLIHSLSCSRVLRVGYSSSVRVANLCFFYSRIFSVPFVASCCCVSKTLVPVSYKRMVRPRIGVCAVWSESQFDDIKMAWCQKDIRMASPWHIRRHFVAYTSVRRRYDVMCLFNAHFAEIHSQAILITQARDLNLESNIQWRNPRSVNIAKYLMVWIRI